MVKLNLGLNKLLLAAQETRRCFGRDRVDEEARSPFEPRRPGQDGKNLQMPMEYSGKKNPPGCVEVRTRSLVKDEVVRRVGKGVFHPAQDRLQHVRQIDPLPIVEAGEIGGMEERKDMDLIRKTRGKRSDGRKTIASPDETFTGRRLFFDEPAKQASMVALKGSFGGPDLIPDLPGDEGGRDNLSMGVNDRGARRLPLVFKDLDIRGPAFGLKRPDPISDHPQDFGQSGRGQIGKVEAMEGGIDDDLMCSDPIHRLEKAAALVARRLLPLCQGREFIGNGPNPPAGGIGRRSGVAVSRCFGRRLRLVPGTERAGPGLG